MKPCMHDVKHANYLRDTRALVLFCWAIVALRLSFQKDAPAQLAPLLLVDAVGWGAHKPSPSMPAKVASDPCMGAV